MNHIIGIGMDATKILGVPVQKTKHSVDDPLKVALLQRNTTDHIVHDRFLAFKYCTSPLWNALRNAMLIMQKTIDIGNSPTSHRPSIFTTWLKPP